MHQSSKKPKQMDVKHNHFCCFHVKTAAKILASILLAGYVITAMLCIWHITASICIVMGKVIQGSEVFCLSKLQMGNISKIVFHNFEFEAWIFTVILFIFSTLMAISVGLILCVERRCVCIFAIVLQVLYVIFVYAAIIFALVKTGGTWTKIAFFVAMTAGLVIPGSFIYVLILYRKLIQIIKRRKICCCEAPPVQQQKIQPSPPPIDQGKICCEHVVPPQVQHLAPSHQIPDCHCHSIPCTCSLVHPNPNPTGHPPQMTSCYPPLQIPCYFPPPQNSYSTPPPQNQSSNPPPQNQIGNQLLLNQIGNQPPENQSGNQPLENESGNQPPENQSGYPVTTQDV